VALAALELPIATALAPPAVVAAPIAIALVPVALVEEAALNLPVKMGLAIVEKIALSAVLICAHVILLSPKLEAESIRGISSVSMGSALLDWFVVDEAMRDGKVPPSLIIFPDAPLNSATLLLVLDAGPTTFPVPLTGTATSTMISPSLVTVTSGVLPPVTVMEGVLMVG
jgi:hypothetical protein